MSMQHRILMLALAMSVAGCEGASRFGDFSRPSASGATQPPPPPRQQTFTPAPTTRVESTSLPPLRPATPGAQAGVSPQPGLPPAGSSVPIDPPSEPKPVERAPARPPVEEERPAQTAARPEPAPRQEAPPTRTNVTGNWSAREASGGACRVTLSTTPTLDLYKASSAGCKTREMQRVTAWELRGEEIYLYETGGSVAARLRKSGSNYEGASAKTGAPIVMSK